MNARASMLICCESSGIVREAMRAQGVDAYSCDLLAADDGSPHHIQGDALAAMRSREWAAFGFHPPCTYLTSAGLHWNGRGRGWERTQEAIEFVRALMSDAGPRPYYLENPVGSWRTLPEYERPRLYAHLLRVLWRCTRSLPRCRSRCLVLRSAAGR